jgi:6-phosphogluconolactonase
MRKERSDMTKIKTVTKDTPQEAAIAAAAEIAELLKRACEARGLASVAFSGGSTPGMMFDALVAMDVSWDVVHVFQVDERAVPDGSPTRNLTELRLRLLDRVAIPAGNVHPMPVTSTDLDEASGTYARESSTILGMTPTLDVVHLGLGADGHTASLVPSDPVLDVNDRDVASTTNEYQGTRRMTLTYPMINRSRSIVWLAAGADKAEQIARLLHHDPSIPAGRVAGGENILFIDRAAAELRA